jgi:hypothetical protein
MALTKQPAQHWIVAIDYLGTIDLSQQVSGRPAAGALHRRPAAGALHRRPAAPIFCILDSGGGHSVARRIRRCCPADESFKPDKTAVFSDGVVGDSWW